MKYIDLENWKRKEHFEFFYKMDYPQYNICMNLDVTNFLKFVKDMKFSFYYSMIYAVTNIINITEDFKYRIRDGKVIFHDIIHPSFTDIGVYFNDELFKMVTLDFNQNLEIFQKTAKITSQNQTKYFPKTSAGRDDLIYISCIPWISFTHISHTISLNRNESVPRISWGKYYKSENKVLLPFSVQVHHALNDGIHVGKYIEKLQAYLNEIKNALKN